MGEMADFFIDQALMEEPWFESDYELEFENEFDKNIWTTKDGRKLNICEMSTQHLTNTIALINRKDNRKVKAMWIPKLQKELNDRLNTEWSG